MSIRLTIPPRKTTLAAKSAVSTLPYNDVHTRPLSEYSATIRRHLPANPQAALDFPAYRICIAPLDAGPHCANTNALRLKVTRLGSREMPFLSTIPEDYLAWRDAKTAPERFRQFCVLPTDAKKSLLGAAAAATLPANLSNFNTAPPPSRAPSCARKSTLPTTSGPRPKATGTTPPRPLASASPAIFLVTTGLPSRT